MPLPAAQQAKMDALRTPSGNDDGTPPTQPTATPSAAPPSVDSSTSVTISREEFNALQASADRVKAAEGRAENMQMDLETLQARLTALEKAPKDIPNGGTGGERRAAPPVEDDDWAPAEVQFTEQETTDYGESRAFIEKVVLETLNKVLPKVLGSVKGLKGALAEVKEQVATTVQRTAQVEGRDFNDQVRAKLKEDGGDFDQVVNHEHWRAFCESVDPDTEDQYYLVLQDAVAKRKMGVVLRVFKAFRTKYGLLARSGTTGYEGAAPGGGSHVPDSSTAPNKLPFSERQKAHKKFINGEMSAAEYQVIAEEYSKAEKEDRIDYDA